VVFGSDFQIAGYISAKVETFPDRIVRHAGDKTPGIGRVDVLSSDEGDSWTFFGFVDGLRIRSKDGSIFIPAACSDYAEIRSRLGGWETRELRSVVRLRNRFLHR
jgi:hypothetical protein